MKLFFTLITIIGLAASAMAQSYSQYSDNATTISGGTNKVTELATNTVNVIFDCTGQDTIGVSLYGRCIVSNWAKIRLDFQPSANNTYFANQDLLSLSFNVTTNADTTGYCYQATNIATKGFGYLKLVRVCNTDYHGIVTNLTINYQTKR